jgi:adenine-specific DNA methylase
MTETPQYCKRLIEVDLPIKRISAHARREKSIRHGHISTLHIWWARRPLAACRAVVCAALWPDPADPLCPETFRIIARQEMLEWATKHLGLLSEESYKRFNVLSREPNRLNDCKELRTALLDFIADFANWDRAADPAYLATARALTASAHTALGGTHGSRPLVVDPFAGGGAIPLEALRVGADVFASDLNAIPVLLNKVVLEYIPRFGATLGAEVRRIGVWVKAEAEKKLRQYYPANSDGDSPLAYIWARTVLCEGPGCGAEIPLIRSGWLSRRRGRYVGLVFSINKETKKIDLELVASKTALSSDDLASTVRKGAATCPICGHTMKVDRVRLQLRARRGGTSTARLLAVVTSRPGEQGRHYRLPTNADLTAVQKATAELARLRTDHRGTVSLVPEESTADYHSFVNRGPIYGMLRWDDYFTSRQLLVLTTLAKLVGQAGDAAMSGVDRDFAAAVQTCMALALDRQIDATSSLCRWHTSGEKHTATFGRQALPMVWDFSEVNVLSEATGGFAGAIQWVAKVCDENAKSLDHEGRAEQASATLHPLPDDSADAIVTDPPYYYSVQYADLSDYFYVWLKRSLGHIHPALFRESLSPKQDEIIVQSPGHQYAKEGKNITFYQDRMRLAMGEARRVLAPTGIGVVVFAHKSTAGWEAQLQSMIDAGWMITGSWPIDTEMAARVIAQGRAVLASSIHLVCRPREDADGSLQSNSFGDWRDVLRELPIRIHEWMPRLATEGVVGADAIFACLGPALEIFSRFARVEKADGEVVSLGEYLEHVWAAVAREALSMVLQSADVTGLEPDGRLTAIWLWTLAGSNSANAESGASNGDSLPDDADDESPANVPVGGFVLEFDAARKIAQGLGARLDELDAIVEIKGDVARLLPIAERVRSLFGKPPVATAARRPARKKQLGLFADIEEVATEQGWGEIGAPQVGKTTLDRIHQAMLLFGVGRSEALKRFLVEEGVGNHPLFWKLAQSLSALYPDNTDEKRWIDGVLVRKKSLGFA